MATPRRAVIFDMDGLMLDTEPLYRLAWQDAASDFGHTIDDDLYFRLIGRSNRDAERILRGIFGDGLPLPEFRSRWLRRWREHVERGGIEWQPGLGALLDLLERRGIPKAVATSTVRAEALYTLERARLDGGRFEGLVTGDQVERGKPAPDIFVAAARVLGCDPSDCVAFEDSDAGVLAAGGAGMRAVMVPDMKPPSAAAAEQAFRILGSLVEAPALIDELWGRQESELPE